MKAKKETKSPTPSSGGLGGTLISEADEDEDLEDEEADLDEDDFKEVLSNDLISKQTAASHLVHNNKHNNFSPMQILSNHGTC
jgi:hypothetical protein